MKNTYISQMHVSEELPQRFLSNTEVDFNGLAATQPARYVVKEPRPGEPVVHEDDSTIVGAVPNDAPDRLIRSLHCFHETKRTAV